MKKLSLAGLALSCALTLLLGGAVQATPITVTISATITIDDTGFAGVGNPLVVNIQFDDAEPNEDVAPNYLATANPGTLDSFLIVAVTGTIFDVTGTGSTQWEANGDIDLSAAIPGIFLPLSIVINGTGMTPGQIAPDFAVLLPGSEIVVDVDPLIGLGISGTVEADINSVTIVPEPSTALLLGLGLVGLAAKRRRSA